MHRTTQHGEGLRPAELPRRGRSGRDPQHFHRRPGQLHVQRQPEHESRGAGLRDGHQMD